MCKVFCYWFSALAANNRTNASPYNNAATTFWGPVELEAYKRCDATVTCRCPM